MKKCIGINRNKMPQFQASKQTNNKRRNRFKSISKDEDLDISQPQNTNSLITSTTQNSANQESEASKTLQIYQQAKEHIRSAAQYKKKIAVECKLRITAFKQSQAKKHDQNICALSKKAIDHLLKAEKTLSVIRYMKGLQECEQKYYRNMEKSLAQQLRQMSKQLRSQQKQHFDRLKQYQKNSANTAIQLTQTQKQKMRGEFPHQQQSSMAMVQQLEQESRNTQINQLIKSINILSTLYKQLNQLVIEQGSIIDRIDYNIEQTYTHVQKGNQHLRGAEEKASNSCAEKCMLVLLAFIVCFAIVLGFKYSR